MSRKYTHLMGMSKKVTTVFVTPDGVEQMVESWRDPFLEEMKERWMADSPEIYDAYKKITEREEVEFALRFLMVEIGDENGELDLLDKFDDLLFCVVNAARFNAPQSRAESLEKNRDSIDLLRTALKKLKKAQAINPELDISGTFIKLEKNLEMAEQRLPEQKAGRPVDFRTTHALVQLYFHTNQILGKPSYQLIHYFMKAAFPEKEWLPDYLTKRIAVLKKRFPKDDAYQYYLNPPKNLT